MYSACRVRSNKQYQLWRRKFQQHPQYHSPGNNSASLSMVTTTDEFNVWLMTYNMLTHHDQQAGTASPSRGVTFVWTRRQYTAKQSRKITVIQTSPVPVCLCVNGIRTRTGRYVELVDPSGIRWRETSENRCSMRSIACDDCVVYERWRACARSKGRSKNFHDGVRRSPVRCEFCFNVYYRTLRETKIKRRLDRTAGACVHTCGSSSRGQQQ